MWFSKYWTSKEPPQASVLSCREIDRYLISDKYNTITFLSSHIGLYDILISEDFRPRFHFAFSASNSAVFLGLATAGRIRSACYSQVVLYRQSTLCCFGLDPSFLLFEDYLYGKGAYYTHRLPACRAGNTCHRISSL